MSIELRESVATAPVKKGNRWRTVIATPGQGSSGYYSEEVLKRDAAKIVPAGGQSFINHDASRNPKDLLGVFPEGSYWSDEDNAVVGDLQVFSHWAAFVEEVAPHVGMSLYAMGESDDDGNVTAIVEDRMNGCDLVARPGLIGSGIVEKLYESAIQAGSTKPSTTVVQEDEGDTNMEDVKKALADLTNLVGTLVAEKETAVAAEAQVTADEMAVAQAIESYSAAVKAVDEAELLDVQRAEILEAAKKPGADVTALVESAKKIRDAAIEAVKIREGESSGRVVTATDSKGFSLAKIAEAR